MSAPKELAVARPGAALASPRLSDFAPGRSTQADGLANVWLTITKDGPGVRVALMFNKQEMGQGTSTSHAMIVADELDVELGAVDIVQADYDPKYNDPVFQLMLTGGSSGVADMIEPLRWAAARARAAIVAAAAKRLGIPAPRITTEVSTEPGVVVHAASGKRIPYGELLAEAALLPEQENVRLKDPANFRYMGKAARRLDIPDKVAGRAVFGCDLRLPGMLRAALAWSPVYGAAASSWDAPAALTVPGVVAVVETELGPAVLATNSFAAWKGRDALKTQWGPGAQPDISDEVLFAELAANLEKPGIVARSEGDPAAGEAQAVRKIDLTFRQPFLAHAPIEPFNCTVRLLPESVEIWAPTQYQTGWANEAAKVTDLPVDKVVLHTTLAGGGFGRKAMLDVLRATLAVAKAARDVGREGVPIQLLYDRPQEFRTDYLRPGNMARVQAGLDAAGNICFWRQRNTGASVLAELLGFMLAESGLDFTGVEGSDCADYAVTDIHLDWARHLTPTPIGFWRSVGNSHNCLVRESAMEELALLAGEDSLAFRLKRLTNPRAKGVLELAAERFGWGKPLPEGHAAGIAYEKSFGSYVAHAVEISADQASGKVTVHRVVAAIDCGLAVNPLAVTMQVEGATVMGLSALFDEEIHFAGGGMATTNFGIGGVAGSKGAGVPYLIRRMADSPLSIEVHVVDSPEPSTGVGEPGLPSILPAVANALRSLTGARHLTLPLTPERIRAGFR